MMMMMMMIIIIIITTTTTTTKAVCDYEYGICRAIIPAAVDVYLKLMNM